MSNPDMAMTVTTGQQLAAQSPWDSTKKQIIKDSLAPGISDGELALFEAYCTAKGLDPFAGQIHAVMRYDGQTQRKKMTIQIGIDGFRALAEETGEYDGTTLPIYYDKDGTAYPELWLKDTPPFACKVGVRRKGFSAIQWNVGRYSAYVQTTKDGAANSMWQKRGPEQLAKCVESGAFRAAFPQRLGGMYTTEEMAQAENTVPYVDGTATHISEETTPAIHDAPVTASHAQQQGATAQRVLMDIPTETPPQRPPLSPFEAIRDLQIKLEQDVWNDAQLKALSDEDLRNLGKSLQAALKAQQEGGEEV